MSAIYCISGLGADHTIFRNLQITGHTLVPMPWVPHKNGDDMVSYAAKMAARIPDGNDVIVLGLSFGGMLATEIARTHPHWQIILVSSAKTKQELGYDSRILRWISSLRVIPPFMFKMRNFVSFYYLGAHTKEERRLIRQILKLSNGRFYRWCVHTLLFWNSESFTPNIVHIHGTADKVIRPGNVHPDHWIREGSHLMIYNRAGEISALIGQIVAKPAATSHGDISAT